MRRVVRSAVGALAVTMLFSGMLVAIAVSAGAQNEAGTGPADCDSKTYRLLFWPEGHAAIDSVGFPEYLVPHLEVYKGKGNTYVDDDVVGYSEPGVVTVAQDCTPAEEPAAPKDPKKVKSITEGAKLTCKTKKNPILGGNTAVTGGGAAFTLTLGTRRVAEVTLTPPGSGIQSQVVYNSKLCKTSDLPA